MLASEFNLELEHADESNIEEVEAKDIFEILKTSLPAFSSSSYEWIPHHEEDGEIYPARISICGIEPYADDKIFRKEIQKLLSSKLSNLTIMGTGFSV